MYKHRAGASWHPISRMSGIIAGDGHGSTSWVSPRCVLWLLYPCRYRLPYHTETLSPSGYPPAATIADEPLLLSEWSCDDPSPARCCPPQLLALPNVQAKRCKCQRPPWSSSSPPLLCCPFPTRRFTLFTNLHITQMKESSEKASWGSRWAELQWEPGTSRILDGGVGCAEPHIPSDWGRSEADQVPKPSSELVSFPSALGTADVTPEVLSDRQRGCRSAEEDKHWDHAVWNHWSKWSLAAAGSPTCRHGAHPECRWEYEPAPRASGFPAHSFMFSPVGELHIRWVGPYGDALPHRPLAWLQQPGMLLSQEACKAAGL